MIVSALATLLLAFAAMAPGLILCRSERLGGAQIAAVSAASLAVSTMSTALLSVAVHLLTGRLVPALALIPVSLALASAAYWTTRSQRREKWTVEWQVVVVAVIFVTHGVIAYALSVSDLPDGSLRIHAWYNADWFKHIGHTFGIADFGLPARDIFGNAEPLRYYWLSHVLPGAGTAIGGDAWAALYTANVIYSALLAATFFGVAQLTGASKNIAAIVVTLATMICATPRTWGELIHPRGYQQVLSQGVPIEPAFMSLALYIPQHAFALTLLLGWAVLILENENLRARRRLLALVGLSTVMTVSTLFGATMLAGYGLTEIYRRRMAAIPELVVMAVVSLALVFVLGVVTFGDPMAATPQNSAFGTRLDDPAGWLHRGLSSAIDPISRTGLPLLTCLYFAPRWKPNTSSQRNGKILALALAFTAVLSAFLAEVAIGNLVAHEIRLRMINFIAVSAGIIGCWAVSQAWVKGRRERLFAICSLVLLTLAAAPTIILRTIWHGNPRDRFTTIIPADDRKVLAALNAESGSRDIVWQYPESSLLAKDPGGDNWSVVLAGRVNLATPRATNNAKAQPYIQLAHRFFAGENVPIPNGVQWIYLSRELHPDGFDALVERLEGDLAWRRVACQPNACLFHSALKKRRNSDVPNS